MYVCMYVCGEMHLLVRTYDEIYFMCSFKVLTYGLIGAVLMRGVMIAVGVSAIQRFRWIILGYYSHFIHTYILFSFTDKLACMAYAFMNYINASYTKYIHIDTQTHTNSSYIQYTHTYMHTYIHTYIPKYIPTFNKVYIHTVNKYKHTYSMCVLYKCIHMYTYICIHTYTVCIHTFIFTYIHIMYLILIYL